MNSSYQVNDLLPTLLMTAGLILFIFVLVKVLKDAPEESDPKPFK